MEEHLNSILNDLETILKEQNYKFQNSDIIEMKNIVFEFKQQLTNDKAINLDKVKLLSNKVYDLNLNNTFSELTDHISNELYAFEFILEEKIRKGEINYG